MLKINKYSDACAHWGQKFYPLSFDSFGGMVKKSHKALSAIIAKAATSHPISVIAANLLWECVSLALMKAVARQLLLSFPIQIASC